MKRFTSLATLALLAGCSGQAQDPTPGTPTSEGSSAGLEERFSTSRIDANLQALRDLKVFEVRDVLVNIPEEKNCYDLPCPGHEREFVSYADAKARAGEALDRFTRKAVRAAADPTLDARIASSGHCYDTDAQNLKALQDLRVVELGELVLEQPGQNPNCYYAPFGQKLARIAAAFRTP